jgi:hypothetical protein
MANAILSNLRDTNERVIAINMLDAGAPGTKGTIKSFDETYVEFLTDAGKILLFPIHTFSFRRIEQEHRGGQTF